MILALAAVRHRSELWKIRVSRASGPSRVSGGAPGSPLWDQRGGIGSGSGEPACYSRARSALVSRQETDSSGAGRTKSKAENLNAKKPWYAVYTRSRHEKRVAEALEQRDFDTYLPLVPRVSEWHDRKKIVYWPLFPGYVFVRFHPGESSSVLSVPGSVQVIGVSGRPVPIPDEEMDNVRLFAAGLAETGVVPRPAPSVERGERVMVQEGPFSGVRGVVLEHRGADRVLIQIGLTAIGQSLKIELATDSLEPVTIEGREQAS